MSVPVRKPRWKAKHKRLLEVRTDLEIKAPHLLMKPMMTEYEYVVMQGAAIAPHVENDVKISRLILEFILDCGIPDEEYCSWKKFPYLRAIAHTTFFYEHFAVHGDHVCPLFDEIDEAQPKRKRTRRTLKKSVYQ